MGTLACAPVKEKMERVRKMANVIEVFIFLLCVFDMDLMCLSVQCELLFIQNQGSVLRSVLF